MLHLQVKFVTDVYTDGQMDNGKTICSSSFDADAWKCGLYHTDKTLSFHFSG